MDAAQHPTVPRQAPAENDQPECPQCRGAGDSSGWGETHNPGLESTFALTPI